MARPPRNPNRRPSSTKRRLAPSASALKQDLAYFEGLLSDWSAKRKRKTEKKKRASGAPTRPEAHAAPPRPDHDRDESEQISFSF